MTISADWLCGWWNKQRETGRSAQDAKETGHTRQLTAGLSVALCVIATGSCFGWVTPNLLLFLSPQSPVPMTSSQASWMIALIEFGNILTPLPAGYFADLIGRKTVILATGPMYIGCWTIIYYAQTALTLCIARVLQGCVLGVVFTVVPMYLGEIPSPRFRGSIAGLFQIAIICGYLLELCVAPFVSYRMLIVVTAVVPALFIVCFMFQPETPYFYLMKGNENQAARSLACLRGKSRPEEVLVELRDITDNVRVEMSNRASWKDVVGTPTDRQALIIVNIVGTVKSLGGSVAIPTYCVQLFSQAGFHLMSLNTVAFILTVTVLLFSFVSSALSDVVGRRPLLMISCIGCAINLSFVAIFFLLKDYFLLDMDAFTWVCPISLILYCLFTALGLDPISITYRTEMFPSNTRSTAASINSIVFTLGNFMTLKLYQVVADDFGIYVLYFGFALVCLSGAVWLYFNAIETKGKTLFEVQTEIQNSIQPRRRRIGRENGETGQMRNETI